MLDTAKHHRFEFTDWHLYRNDDYSLVYRPSVKTLLRRLVWSAVALVLIIFVHYGHQTAAERLTLRDPSDVASKYQSQLLDMEQKTAEMRESLRQTLSEEEWREFEASEAANRAANQAQIDAAYAERERVNDVFRYGALTIVVLLAVVAILPPLLALYEQITVKRDIRDNFVVSRRRVLTRVQSCRVSTLTPFRVTSQEVIHVRRRGTQRRGDYRWIVTTQSDPSRGGTGDSFEFHVDLWKEAGTPSRRLPGRVATFVDGLHRLTGVSYEGPIVLEPQVFDRPGFRIGATIRLNRGSAARSGRFPGLDDVPPELRGEIESIMAESGRHANSVMERRVVRTQRITVKDADGNVRTYSSPDEMSPEMRALYEEMKRQHGSELE